VEVAWLEGIKQAHGRGTLKLGFTIVVAALIIGLAIVYAGGGAAAPVGEFLFAGAAVVIVWALVLVLWSEAMKGRHD
jgi:O-antigen/teichoic acid export membrane protein